MSAMDHSIDHTQLQSELVDCLSNGLVPYITSSPGVGKSDAVHQFAKTYNLKLIDLRLSQCTPEDLQGFPMREGDKAVFTPFSLFPLEGESLPPIMDEEGNQAVDEQGNPRWMSGWILLLDELSSANKSVQAAAYKLILDRMVGSYKLHENVLTVACGNLITDKAVVHKMSTALQSRMIHFQLKHTVKAWVNWATKKGIDYRIVAYVQFNQVMLMNFSPDHTDSTYACPRTWEFLDRLIRGKPVSRTDSIAKIAGTIGSGAAYDFLTFCEVQKDIPAWADLLDPVKNLLLPVPAEASAKFATICWAASKAERDEVVKILPYIKNFGADFQVIFCRGVLTRYPNIDREIKEFGDYAMGMITDLNAI